MGDSLHHDAPVVKVVFAIRLEGDPGACGEQGELGARRASEEYGAVGHQVVDNKDVGTGCGADCQATEGLAGKQLPALGFTKDFGGHRFHQEPPLVCPSQFIAPRPSRHRPKVPDGNVSRGNFYDV